MAGVSLTLATALWLPAVHLLFASDVDDPKFARALAAQQLATWSKPEARAAALERMRRSNAEWDFMGRTFLVLALSNLALREPTAADAHLATIDTLIDETVRLETARGFRSFMLEYARQGAFRSGVDRSLFVDGEIALMMGARRFVREDERYAAAMGERIAAMRDYMARSPVGVGESYPDEGWMFCNVVALVAMRMQDLLDARPEAAHEPFIQSWLAMARSRLTDPASGLLISSFTFDGRPLDGPEGSSIWMVVHGLAVLDPSFAADQYRRARAELGRERFGFGWATEWPSSWQGPRDIDSGPIIPLVEVSAGSSGMAFLGAATFGDAAWLRSLRTTLDFAAFPVTEESGDADGLRYAASNTVGDAVLLYSSVMGPLWARMNDARTR